MAKTSMKNRGPVSKKDKATLIANLDIKTNEEIAELINRSPEWVAKYRAKYERPAGMKTEQVHVLIEELHKEYFWPEIKEQFTEIECDRFGNRWVQLCEQFGDSVVATDKMQMVDLIRLELLLGRILVDKKNSLEEIKSTTEELNALRKLPIEERIEMNQVVESLMMRKTEAIAVQDTKDKMLKQIQDDKNKLFNQLKSTRDQRINKLEDNKTTFWDLLKILGDKQVEEEHGRNMALIKMAAMKSAEDLGKNYKFVDGTVDRPLYNVETAYLDVIELGERPEDDENKDWMKGDTPFETPDK